MNIERTDDGVIITRVFDAPRDRLWTAFTDPEIVQIWTGCAQTSSVRSTADVRVGGSYRNELDIDGVGTMVMIGTYTEVDPPNRLAYTMNCEPMAGMPQGPDQNITVEFTDVVEDGREKTQVRLVHIGLPDEAKPFVQAGVTASFKRLDKAMAGEWPLQSPKRIKIEA